MRMGFAKGELILEIGYGADCDDALRADIKNIVATDFLENSTNEVVDAVLLWFRAIVIEALWQTTLWGLARRLRPNADKLHYVK